MAGETLLNNRYELVAQQGSGGMSVIYKAVDRALGRTVAVKILRPSLTKDPSFLERFRNEARSVANLSHPNIVTVHDVGNDGQTYYIVMEMVDGQDLKKIVKAEGPLPLDRMLEISIQICAGIGFAHRSGLVHADVKPQNILLKNDGTVKVTDFGIAQAFSDTQPQGEKLDVVWGSPHYFAPEQARGETPTTASDVYSIGIVMFEMLTGRLPYSGTSQQELALAHIRERVPMANEINPNAPVEVANIVHKVMSKEPHARYRYAYQLGGVLQKYRTEGNRRSSQAVAPPPSVSENVKSPFKNNFEDKSSAKSDPVVKQADPTVRFSPAPQAPTGYELPRQAPRRIQRSTQPPPSSASVSPSPVQEPAQQPSQENSPAFYSASFPANTPVEDESGLDVVTIILAILAFIAVAGLIPLFIVVLQARGG